MPAIALTLAACGSTEAQRAGSFTANIVVGTSAPVQITGFAPSFSSESLGGWYAQMTTPGGASTILLLYGGAALPPVGRHQIADFVGSGAEPPRGRFVATGNLDPQLLVVSGFQSVTGTVDITASSLDAVEGTFTYRARQTADGKAVTVEGTFTTANKAQ
jgi:hypothetical protein